MWTDPSPPHEEEPDTLPEPRTGSEPSGFFFHSSYTIKVFYLFCRSNNSAWLIWGRAGRS